MIAGDGDDSQTGSGFSVGRGFDGLDPDRRRGRRGRPGGPDARGDQGSVRPGRRWSSTGGWPRRVLSVVSAALSGEAVTKGRSFFAGTDRRAGGRCRFSPWSTIRPTRGPSARPTYDAEGLACRRNVLIDGGVLRGFVYDTVSASRAGTASTGSAVRGGFSGTPGPGCRALTLAPGPEGFDEDGVLAAVGEGLFVQSMTGVHSGVNPVSGDFSVGAEGLMIRDGRLAEPVREITVASTLQRMLQSVLAIGADLEWLPGIAAGQTLAIGDLQVSGA